MIRLTFKRNYNNCLGSKANRKDRRNDGLTHMSTPNDASNREKMNCK